MKKIKTFWEKRETPLLTGLVIISTGSLFLWCYKNHEPAVYRALGDLMVFGAIYASYEFSKNTAKTSLSLTPILYFKALFWCAVVAGLCAYSMGSHYEDVDPLFGGGTKVIDYAPTTEERAESFWWLFLILTLSSLCGIHKAREYSHYDKIIKKSKKQKQLKEE